MSFSLLKHYLELYINDTTLKVFKLLYCFTSSISHGVENYFPGLWGTGISDAIFNKHLGLNTLNVVFIALIHPIQWTNAIPVGATGSPNVRKRCPLFPPASRS